MPVQETVTPAEVAELLNAYRLAVTDAKASPPEEFVALAAAEPDAVAAEAVDYAADEQGASIDYNWDHPHPLRDALYLAAGDWARHLTVERLAEPVRAEPVRAR